MMSGSSNLDGAKGAATELTRCDKPYGTAALIEPNNVLTYSRFQVSSPVSLIKLMMQQSKCFVVVDRGQAMSQIMQERQLMQSGQLRDGNNFGGGQMVAADFSITPEIAFMEENAGGMGAGLGVLGSMIPGVGVLAVAGAAGLAGSLRFKEAQTTLALTDNRSGIQIAMAEGSASKKDLSMVVGVFGGYANTNATKIVTAGFIDAYNKMISALKASGYAYSEQPKEALQPQQVIEAHGSKTSRKRK